MNSNNFTLDFLRAVVDTLLPGLPASEKAAVLPSASQLELDQKLYSHLASHPERAKLSAALEAITQQAQGLDHFVAADEATATAILEKVEQEQAAVFAALLFAVSADYYESKEVLEAFGWRPTPPQPLGYALRPFDEALLAAVKQMQPIWRKP